MNPVFKLYRLQQVDSQMDGHRARLDQIAAILADHAALNAARDRAETTAQALAEAQKELRTAEYNTHSQRDKIKQTETRLYSGAVKNPKELEDLQNEAAALKRYLAVLEDRQLEAMLKVDEVAETAGTAQEAFERIEQESLETNASLVEERGDLEHEITRLTEEREAAASGIAADTLQQYDELRLQRQGVAVALVKDNACSACGSTLPASLRMGARDPNKVAHCSFCRRILYAQ